MYHNIKNKGSNFIRNCGTITRIKMPEQTWESFLNNLNVGRDKNILAVIVA
jgi:hypothetical protein